MKVFVFDLDGTLAELGRPVTDKNIERLKALSKKGRIAVSSGKPLYYLCGFMRQLGVENPILIGENGSAIQFGVDLPPKRQFFLPTSEKSKRNLKELRKLFDTYFSDRLWYQPNDVCLTPFPESEEDFEAIEKMIVDNPQLLEDVDHYRHCDSYDFAPKGISKYESLGYLCEILGISAADVVAIGDGVNDYPMFDFACYSVGIHVENIDKVDVNFMTIDEALEHLLAIS